MRQVARQQANHLEGLRTVTAFAINSSRTFQAEWQAAAVASHIPEVDAAITEIQNQQGGTRDAAVREFVARRRALLTQPDFDNGGGVSENSAHG